MTGGPLITENAPGNFTLVGILQAETNTAEIQFFKFISKPWSMSYNFNDIEIRTQIYMETLQWNSGVSFIYYEWDHCVQRGGMV